ncbi:Uncharacterized protein Fot_22579 [Forsythia ovata]|uniref:Uncharacterized protein n=1 Tax=Forsythia ovata TaxID=205694 RepID=A0ABD1UY41_9LAMI
MKLPGCKKDPVGSPSRESMGTKIEVQTGNSSDIFSFQEESIAVHHPVRHKSRAQVLKLQEDWDDSTVSSVISKMRIQNKMEAATRRERALAYAFSQQKRLWQMTYLQVTPFLMWSAHLSTSPGNNSIFHSLRPPVSLPPPSSQPLSVISYTLSLIHSPTSTVSAALSTTSFLIYAATGRRLTYTTFLHQVHSLSSSLRSLCHSLSKNDVAFIPLPAFSICSGTVFLPSFTRNHRFAG